MPADSPAEKNMVRYEKLLYSGSPSPSLILPYGLSMRYTAIASTRNIASRYIHASPSPNTAKAVVI